MTGSVPVCAVAGKICTVQFIIHTFMSGARDLCLCLEQGTHSSLNPVLNALFYQRPCVWSTNCLQICPRNVFTKLINQFNLNVNYQHFVPLIVVVSMATLSFTLMLNSG